MHSYGKFTYHDDYFFLCIPCYINMAWSYFLRKDSNQHLMYLTHACLWNCQSIIRVVLYGVENGKSPEKKEVAETEKEEENHNTTSEVAAEETTDTSVVKEVQPEEDGHKSRSASPAKYEIYIDCYQ